MRKWLSGYPAYWAAQTALWLCMHFMLGYVLYLLNAGEGRGMYVGVQLVTAPMLMVLAIAPITVVYFKGSSRWRTGLLAGSMSVALFNAALLLGA